MKGRLRLRRLDTFAVRVDQKTRSVVSGRNYDPDRLLCAFLLVELSQPLAQPMHFHTHARVLGLLKVLRFPKNIDGDGVFSDGFGILD